MDFKRLISMVFAVTTLAITGCPDDGTQQAGTDTEAGNTTTGGADDGDDGSPTTLTTSQMTGGQEDSTGMPPTDDSSTGTPPTDDSTTAGPAGGDCCAVHKSAGCDDPTCEQTVCAEEAFCCTFEWDSICTGIANDQCAVCGAGSSSTGPGGSESSSSDGGNMDQCCDPTPGTPGCANQLLEDCVCAFDDFCCATEWDQQCVSEAINSCGANCPIVAGDCCAAGMAPGCDDAECEDSVCAVDPFCCNNTWDGICADQALGICTVCGAARTDCCTAGGEQGCSDDACVNAICGEFGDDPSCCTSAWTQACADLAASVCEVCEAQFEGDCCIDNGTPGCEDAACSDAVCAADAFCCNTTWDQVCADQAAGLCMICGAGAGDCCTANGEQGCDSGQCVNVICGDGGFDPTCCTDAWTQACADEANVACTTCTATVACDEAAISGCVDEDPGACVCEACDAGGGCSLQEDCVCDDCDADGFCSNPANCNNNGLCDPYNEGCVCADCAGHPSC